MKKIFTILCATVIAISMTACSEVKTNAELGSTSNSSSVETTEKQIYSDDLVNVYFVKKHAVPGINGEMYIDLTVKNKSDKAITVALTDGYFNDNTVMFGSGVPLNILPNKKGSNSFFGKYDGTVDSIQKIGFKLMIMDKNAASLETTENIEIEF